MLTTRGALPGRAAIAILVAILSVSACGSTPRTPSPSTGPADTGADTADTGAVMNVLAESGIAVFEDADEAIPLVAVSGPSSPFAFLRWQARNLAVDLAARSGLSALDVDAIGIDGGMPPDAPFSLLIAGWAAATDTPAARHARELLEDPDWARPGEVVIPDLVLVLFVSDLALTQAGTASAPRREAGLLGVAGGARPVRQVRPVVAAASPAASPTSSGVCATIQGWAEAIVDKLFGLLMAPPGDGFLGMLANAWNAAVGLAKEVFLDLLGTVVGFVAIVQKVAAAIGVLSWMASFLKGWELKLTATPATTHFTHPGAAPVSGTVVAKVEGDGEGDWPTTVKECAELAQVKLPDPAAPGKPITWADVTQSAPVKLATITAGDSDATIGSDRTATMTYAVSAELPADTEGKEFNEPWKVRAIVERISHAEIDALKDNIFLSDQAGQAIEGVLGKLGTEKLNDIWNFARLRGDGTVVVGFHRGGGQECLTGYWEADRMSYEALVRSLLGGFSEVTGVGGSLTRVYVGDTFVERMDGLLIKRRTTIGPKNKPLNIIDALVTMDGHSIGTYSMPNRREPSGTITYSGTTSELVSSAVVTVDGVVTQGFPLDPLPAFSGTEERTYACDGDTFLETWQGGAYQLLWRRDAPGGPVDDGWGNLTPHTEEPRLIPTGIVTIDLDGKTHTFVGAECAWFEIGGLEYFSIRAGTDPDDPEASPGAGASTSDPGSFQMTLVLTQEQPYETGTGAPSGRVGTRSFTLATTTEVLFELEFFRGTFRGPEKGSTDSVPGTFSC